MSQYLQLPQYYEDLYDLGTIRTCMNTYTDIRQTLEKRRGELKTLTDEQFTENLHKSLGYILVAIEMSRFERRKEQIDAWMEADRKRQERYDTAQPPCDSRCLSCGSPMRLLHKDEIGGLGTDLEIIFMFECPTCTKRRALYENGTEWQYEPPACPTCRSPLKSTIRNRKGRLTTVYTCSKCGYSRKDVDDFAASRKEREEQDQRDRELLQKYREEFCWSEKDGNEAIRNFNDFKRVMDDIKVREEKQKDPAYQKAMQLRKIGIVEMEQLVVEAITPLKYIRFALGQPEMGRYIEVSFTVQDADSSRSEWDSEHTLRKAIIRALEGTNWRLMTNGINGKLGVLSGRVKGLNRVEDMVER